MERLHNMNYIYRISNSLTDKFILRPVIMMCVGGTPMEREHSRIRWDRYISLLPMAVCILFC